MRFAMVGAAVVVAACKFPDLPPLDPDAAADHTVGGTVEGLWTGGNLTLRLTAANATPEILNVTTEGAFTFPTRVAVGATFTFAIDSQPAQHTCTIENPAGQVGQLDITDLRVGCVADIAVTLQLSTLAPFSFDPQRTRQSLDVSLLQSQVAVTANGPAGATATLQGTPILLGTPAPTPLAQGPNTVAVAFTVGPLSRTYLLDLDRGGVPVIEHAYSKTSNREANDVFGSAIAGYGEFVAIGAPGEDSGTQANGADNTVEESGAVYIFRRSGAQLSYLKAIPAVTLEQLGSSVAMDANYLIAGGHQVAVVWRRDGLNWVQEARLTLPSGTETNRFGAAVGVHGDTIAISDPHDSFGGTDFAGAVYIFRRLNGTWTQEAIIRSPDPDFLDKFGNALSVGPDVIAVAARDEDSAARGISSTVSTDDAATDSGAVYIYRRLGMNWSLDAVIKSSNSDPMDFFGTSVGLDGDVLAVGASGEASGSGDPTDNTVQGAGAVYAFRYTGNTWIEESYLKAPAPVAWDYFGWTVSVRGDLIAAGAPETELFEDGPGFVCLFRRNTGLWSLAHRLAASNPDNRNNYGISVAVLDEVMVVGNSYESNYSLPDDNAALQSGAAYFLR